MSTQFSSGRRYLSIHDAAEYVGLSVMTIRRRIADGTLTGYRLGPRIIRVDRNELESLLQPIPAGGGARG